MDLTPAFHQLYSLAAVFFGMAALLPVPGKLHRGWIAATRICAGFSMLLMTSEAASHYGAVAAVSLLAIAVVGALIVWLRCALHAAS